MNRIERPICNVVLMLRSVLDGGGDGDLDVGAWVTCLGVAMGEYVLFLWSRLEWLHVCCSYFLKRKDGGRRGLPLRVSKQHPRPTTLCRCQGVDWPVLSLNYTSLHCTQHRFSHHCNKFIQVAINSYKCYTIRLKLHPICSGYHSS